MEWLHQGSHGDLAATFLHFVACDFPCENPLKKVLQNRYFLALASRSGFGAAISDALARNSIVFCTTGSADRTVGCVKVPKQEESKIRPCGL